MVPANSTVRANMQWPVNRAGEAGDMTTFPMVRRESRLQGFVRAGGLGSLA